jgi:hypothetical protein
MSPHYRHTQTGWVMIGLLVVVAAFVLPPLLAAGVGLLTFVAVTAAILLLFGSLTVEVGASEVRLRFGVGVIRKRVPLETVTSWRQVRNPWYSGWGIRLGPGFTLWNVSGFDAVELAFTSGGRRFRIGTDEPERLLTAIGEAKGIEVALPGTAGETLPERGAPWRGFVLLLLVVGALLGALFWSQTRPPSVRVGPRGLEVAALFYGHTFPLADIESLSLEDRLPRILLRTNGFAAGGTLRGHFRVEGLGDGRLYVERSHPPYILVRLRRGGFVILNFRDADDTRNLYRLLTIAWSSSTGARKG